MLQIKPGRKTPIVDGVTKSTLLAHMQKESLSVPVLAIRMGLTSRHVLYNILSERSGLTASNNMLIQRYLKGVE